LVEIPSLVFIYADEIKNTAVKYDGLAFGGHKNLTQTIAVMPQSVSK